MRITVDAATQVGIIIKEKGFKQCAIANKAGFSAFDYKANPFTQRKECNK